MVLKPDFDRGGRTGSRTCSNSIYDAGQATFKFVAKSPFNWWIPVVAGPKAARTVVDFSRAHRPPTIAGSFQGLHTKAELA